MAQKIACPKTVKALEVVLADTFTLYLKTHNCHWHITGPDFVPMHEFLGGLYKDLFGVVDQIGERIRQLGSDAPATMKEFLKLTSIKESSTPAKSKDIIKMLMKDHLVLIDTYKKLLSASAKENDMVTNDFAIERLAYHEKIVWMLGSF